MNDDSVKVAVEGLLQVRKQHRAYTGETVPQSLDHAYKIQDFQFWQICQKMTDFENR